MTQNNLKPKRRMSVPDSIIVGLFSLIIVVSIVIIVKFGTTLLDPSSNEPRIIYNEKTDYEAFMAILLVLQELLLLIEQLLALLQLTG